MTSDINTSGTRTAKGACGRYPRFLWKRRASLWGCERQGWIRRWNRGQFGRINSHYSFMSVRIEVLRNLDKCTGKVSDRLDSMEGEETQGSHAYHRELANRGDIYMCLVLSRWLLAHYRNRSGSHRCVCRISRSIGTCDNEQSIVFVGARYKHVRIHEEYDPTYIPLVPARGTALGQSKR